MRVAVSMLTRPRSIGMSRWSGAVGGKNWARKAWEAAVKGEQEEEEDDDMLVAAEEALCGLCCGVV